MTDEHDDKTTRCRRLGHEVRFGYCRQENEGAPCRLVLDCWWQGFDVQTFLKENLTPEAYDALESASAPDKVLTLVELIEQAKARSADAPTPASDSPEEPETDL